MTSFYSYYYSNCSRVCFFLIFSPIRSSFYTGGTLLAFPTYTNQHHRSSTCVYMHIYNDDPYTCPYRHASTDKQMYYCTEICASRDRRASSATRVIFYLGTKGIETHNHKTTNIAIVNSNILFVLYQSQ